MIIKHADDVTHSFAALERKMQQKDISPVERHKIERTLAARRSGASMEHTAAYFLNFFLERSKNWMVLHDLRLVHGNRTAQIDHLLINRFLSFYVCESKFFSEGISINTSGEFAAFWQGKPFGIPSPLEQCRRHCAVLEAVLKETPGLRPTRLHLPLPLFFKSLLFVAPTARIERPTSGTFQGEECLLKVDQFGERLERERGELGNLKAMYRLGAVIGQHTLQTLAERLCSFHTPALTHQDARCAQPLSPSSSGSLGDVRIRFPRRTLPSSLEKTASPETSTAVSTHIHPSTSSPLVCAACHKALTEGVVAYCRTAPQRFGKALFCMTCQRLHDNTRPYDTDLPL